MAEAKDLSAKLVIAEDGEEKVYPIEMVEDGLGTAKILLMESLKNAELIFLDKRLQKIAIYESAITYIDGDKGILLYRGYPVEQLAEHSTYLKTAKLLRDGELPGDKEYAGFKTRVLANMEVNPAMLNIMKAYPPGTPAMLLINTMMTSLGAFYPDLGDQNTTEGRENITTNFLAKMPTLVAGAIRVSRQETVEDLQKLEFVKPKPELGFVENFLRMCFAKNDADPYRPDPVVVDALNCLFICHGDHEQNASTNVVRLVAETDAPWCVTFPAGEGSLWGKLHGGAAQASAEMLAEIGGPENVRGYLENIKATGGKVMGFGHRIYKNGDPRAAIIEQVCVKVLGKLNLKDEMLETAQVLEKAVAEDPGYNGLRPNVDFRSGILYSAMGFRPPEYTGLFALARSAGWAAQWTEDLEKGKRDLGRPRQRYVGKGPRDLPMSARVQVASLAGPGH
jgi:citrate synthase